MDIAKRNERIVAAVKAGQPRVAMARRYGLSRARVSQITRDAGLPVKEINYRPIEKRAAKEAARLLARGESLTAVAEVVGHSTGGLAYHLSQRGLYQVNKNQTPWTTTEERILRMMWSTRTAFAIAVRLNRTRNEVIGKAHRMGLSKPKTQQEAA